MEEVSSFGLSVGANDTTHSMKKEGVGEVKVPIHSINFRLYTTFTAITMRY